MKHLTVEDIIDYVSFNTMEDANLMHAANVISHIRTCKECFERVRAFQLVYDKLMAEGKNPQLEAFTEDLIKEAFEENSRNVER